MAGSFPMLAAYRPDQLSRARDELLGMSPPSGSKSDEEDEGLITQPSPFNPQDNRPRGISRTHRKLVFTDPVAFRYLEEDESTTVLARRHKLDGYELYVVEQWIVSRTQATFTICSYTGDTSHSVLVNVLAVPHDQSTWSQRLKVYFDAISQSYAREKETHLGTLMVTNLSGFPSALNVIAVPDGDIKKHREDFIVNENLKRMGCAGRAAMSLQYPQSSTINKFHHMYRTSTKVPLYPSVTEIVRFCQLALVLYGKLDSTYADGLLCDITERGISEWWNEIGIDFHNVEPSDGILGPTTVSALIGLVIGAYNRLKETGAPVGKDPIELSSMKRAIAHFQKANKMERSRRLDRATLDRLHRVTASKADDEGLGVTRALKSTVAGLSGKGGEMLARGFGGGKEKAGIAEVETLDIEVLSQLVTGRSMKWLWQGKEKGPSSAGLIAPPDELNGRVFSTDASGNFIWTSETKDGVDDLDFVRSFDPDEREKRRSRLRGAVGLTSSKIYTKPSHTDDESQKPDLLPVPSAVSQLRQQSQSQRSSQSSSREFPNLNLALADSPATSLKNESLKADQQKQNGERDMANGNLPPHRHALRGVDHAKWESPSKQRVRQELASLREELKDERYQSFSADLKLGQPQSMGLRRTLSAIQLRVFQEARTARLPRALSYSIVSDSFEFPSDLMDGDGAAVPVTELPLAALIKVRQEEIRRSRDVGMKISTLNRGLVPFAVNRIERVEYIVHGAQGELEELNSLYYQHLEEYQAMQATSTDLVAREKTSLNEAMRSMEMLSQKIDYELGSLQSRMQEVEESVDDFERRVLDIEASIKVLVAEDEKPRQSAWYERWLGFRKQPSPAMPEREKNVAEALDRSLDVNQSVK